MLTAIENYLLNNHSHVTIVDRSRVKQVLAEKQLQESDLFSQETAAEVGKLLAAHAVIVGQVSTWQGFSEVDQSSLDKIVGLPIRGKKIKNRCNVEFSLRAIDVGSGRVWLSVTADGDDKSFGEACKQALDDKHVRRSLDRGLRTRSSSRVATTRS